MAKVLAWKAWYVEDDSVIRFVGKTREQWAALPDDGLQIVMLYYDEFALDGVTRYRGAISGNDIYWMSIGEGDDIYGQSDESAETVNARDPQALVKRGTLIDTDLFTQIEQEAMADYEEDW